jgi:hypothetical protein
MIFYATPGQAAALPVAALVAEHATTSRIYRAAAEAGPPAEISLGCPGEQAEIKPPVQDVLEEFDWDSAKVMREYVRLEQKALAKQATPEELSHYRSMKRDRNGRVFAERYVRDYAEVQRLKKLSEKLAEIQHYLRPIEL